MKNLDYLLKKTETENEKAFITRLFSLLSDNFGEQYSWVDVSDMAEEINWTKSKVKGVLGSLVKKQILSTYDTGTGYDVIFFVEQIELRE